MRFSDLWQQEYDAYRLRIMQQDTEAEEDAAAAEDAADPDPDQDPNSTDSSGGGEIDDPETET